MFNLSCISVFNNPICKTGSLGINMNICPDCGHIETHNNSCRDRNCPNCQAVNKEIWVDRRRSEVIDTSYYHVVLTLPHELNPLIYCTQKRLYGLFHMRSKNLKMIFRIQGGQRFRSRYTGMTMAELMKTIWKIDFSICPVCGCHQMRHLGRTFASSG